MVYGAYGGLIVTLMGPMASPRGHWKGGRPFPEASQACPNARLPAVLPLATVLPWPPVCLTGFYAKWTSCRLRNHNPKSQAGSNGCIAFWRWQEPGWAWLLNLSVRASLRRGGGQVLLSTARPKSISQKEASVRPTFMETGAWQPARAGRSFMVSRHTTLR